MKEKSKLLDHLIKGHVIHGNKLLIVCNHLTRFGGLRHFGSGDKMYLICHVASRDHVFKELRNLMG